MESSAKHARSTSILLAHIPPLPNCVSHSRSATSARDHAGSMGIHLSWGVWGVGCEARCPRVPRRVRARFLPCGGPCCGALGLASAPVAVSRREVEGVWCALVGGATAAHGNRHPHRICTHRTPPPYSCPRSIAAGCALARLHAQAYWRSNGKRGKDFGLNLRGRAGSAAATRSTIVAPGT